MAPLIAWALKLAATGVIPEVVRALGLGGEKAADAAEKVVSVAEAITGAQGQQAVDLIQAKPELQVELQKRLADERQFFADLEFKREQLYVGETQDARHVHAGDRGVYWLGIAVLATFAIVMVACLYGAYKLLTGGLTIKDIGIVAAVFGFLGTIVGYVAANAQQVVSYFFGSSRGSTDKSREMADAIKKLGAV